MSFRRRLTLAAAGAVAVAVVVASLAAWIVVRGQLRGEVDDELRQRAELLGRFAPEFVVGDPIPGPPPTGGQRVFFVQVVTPSGDVIRFGNGPRFDVPARDPSGDPVLSDQRISGTH